MLTLFPSGTRTRMRWRNNLGWTTEIARAPDSSPDGNSGAFLWRASVAEIDEDSDFSVFEGIDRSIAVIDGDGIVLVIDEDVHSLRPGDPAVRFSGEARTSCMLVAGPTRDFNVMTQRGACEHEVWTMDLLADTSQAVDVAAHDSTLIYVVKGEVDVRVRSEHPETGAASTAMADGVAPAGGETRGKQFRIGPGDSVLCDASVALEGSGRVVLAKLRNVAG